MNRKSIFINLTLLLTIVFVGCSGDDAPTFSPNLGNAPETPNLFDLSNLINELRENGQKCSGTQYEAVPILTYNSLLNQIAKDHAEYMNSIDELTHLGENETTVGDRAAAIGYNFTVVSENLAKGYADEASVVDAWKNSSGHCENIMEADVREMGVGTSGAYWVMVYGVE